MTENSNIKTNLSEAEVYESMGLWAEALATYEKILDEDDITDTQVMATIEDHIERLKKKLEEDLSGDQDEEKFSQEAMDHIKTRTPDEKDIAPILDRASVFLEKGLYEEAADEYAMLFSIGYSYTSIIPPIIEFLRTFCFYGYLGRELSKVIDKFNLQSNELAEISALFGVEIGKQNQFPAAIGLLEKAKELDPGNTNIEKMYTTIVDRFMDEPRTIFLIRRTRLTQDQLIDALGLSFSSEKSFYQILIDRDFIEKDRLLKALSDYYKCPAVKPDVNIEQQVRLGTSLEKDVLLCQGWVPLDVGPHSAKVVVDDPEDTYRNEQIKSILSTDNISFCIGFQEDIELLIEQFVLLETKIQKEKTTAEPKDEGDIVVADIVDMFESKNGLNSENKLTIRPQLISADIITLVENGKYIFHEVKIKDISDQKISAIVTPDAYERLNRVEVGDMIEDVIFYLGWGMLRTKSLVKNVKQISEGSNKGHYLMEIESNDLF